MSNGRPVMEQPFMGSEMQDTIIYFASQKAPEREPDKE